MEERMQFSDVAVGDEFLMYEGGVPWKKIGPNCAVCYVGRGSTMHPALTHQVWPVPVRSTGDKN
jgi:hypothetical protein